MNRPAKWPEVIAALVVGLMQLAVLGLLLVGVHRQIEQQDWATAAVCALVFLGLVIEWKPERR